MIWQLFFSYIQEERVGRFPLSLTRGRVVHHPNQMSHNAYQVTTQICNDRSSESVHHNLTDMPISIIQSREEHFRSESNQIRSDLTHNRSPSNNTRIFNQSGNPGFVIANICTSLRDDTLPPSYAEATNSVPETS